MIKKCGFCDLDTAHTKGKGNDNYRCTKCGRPFRIGKKAIVGIPKHAYGSIRLAIRMVKTGSQTTQKFLFRDGKKVIIMAPQGSGAWSKEIKEFDTVHSACEFVNNV